MATVELLLAQLGTVVIPAITVQFVVREKLVVGNSPIKIGWLGEDLEAWFLGKIEEPTVEITLRYAKLTMASRDGPIMAELGENKETTLAQIYALMERQPNGEQGVLLTNRWANIFYVCDANGDLRAVDVYWGVDGWYINARSVAGPRGWGGMDRVFSRNS